MAHKAQKQRHTKIAYVRTNNQYYQNAHTHAYIRLFLSEAWISLYTHEYTYNRFTKFLLMKHVARYELIKRSRIIVLLRIDNPVGFVNQHSKTFFSIFRRLKQWQIHNYLMISIPTCENICSIMNEYDLNSELFHFLCRYYHNILAAVPCGLLKMFVDPGKFKGISN